MSSLNVRFAQKTRGETDLLNCTNLPSSDSARHNHRAGAGVIRRGEAEQTRQRVFVGTALKGKEERGPLKGAERGGGMLL